MSLVLARIRVRETPPVRAWLANAYAVHQRLSAAFPGDPRLLFRIEDERTILVQAHREPDWARAFAGFHALDGQPEHKEIDPQPLAGAEYRFRLVANPVISRLREPRDRGEAAASPEYAEAPPLGGRPPLRRGRRVGLMREADQRAWLERKLRAAGTEPVVVEVRPLGLQRSRRPPTSTKAADGGTQVHFAVRFEGTLRVMDPAALRAALETGIGPAKGFGFGLLSLARVGAGP